MSYQTLFIIGAGRSGTNILRDTLTKLPDWETWDCDEINLIWRHGNLSMPHDVFGPEQATPSVKRFIKSRFDKLHNQSGSSVIVEKTCANSLRVPFINEIFPDARYLYMVRDGRDIALSAARRWTAPVEPAYLLKKLRYAPMRDIPHYGARFLSNRIHQYRSNERRQASWGPIFPEMADWVANRPLVEVCAKQWTACVEESDKAFAKMTADKVKKITYEALVSNPQKIMKDVCDWAGEGVIGKLPKSALDTIHSRSLNEWKQHGDQLTKNALDILNPVLDRHGYEITT